MRQAAKQKPALFPRCEPPAPLLRAKYCCGKTVLLVLDVTDKQIADILDILTKRDFDLPLS